MIGGNLARPHRNMPDLFPAGTIWEKYPYLLPNLFSAATCVFGVVVGVLFLEETHVDKKDRHDPGLALGQCIIRRFSWKRHDDEDEDISETTSLLSHDENPPRYQTTENSPQLTSTPATDVEDQPLLDAEVVGDRLREASEDSSVQQPQENAISASKAFTKPVIMNIISYGILAL